MFGLRWFYNLRVAHKLAALLMPFLVSIIGLAGWNSFANRVVDKINQEVDSAYRMRGDVMTSALISLHYGAAVEDQILDTISAKREDLHRITGRMSESDEWIEKLDNAALINSYTELMLQIKRITKLEATGSHGVLEEATLLGDMAVTFNETLQTQIDSLSQRRLELRNDMDILSIAILVVGILLSALMGYFITRSITQPLQKAVVVADSVAQGKLTQHITVTSRDEIGELSGAFNHMVDELSDRDKLLQQELKERRRIEAKLSQIAHFDSVTQLPNRHSFNIQIEKALINYKYNLEKFALIYIDLDNFKYVNDTFGHHIGDLLLARIGKLLLRSLRKEDFLARLGGDEFVIIIGAFAENSQIKAVAEKILTALQAPFTLENREAFIGASIGIAICPGNGQDRETLQRQADSAMYRAKTLGKNNFQFYQDDVSHTQKNRISIEAQLHHALERNEIVVYYQPIVEIAGGKVAGFEALVRWIKQDGTVIRPDEFITLAEEIGLIVDIGRHVLNTAAAQTVEWVDKFGLGFIAVNFSSRQFKQNDLVADIFNALQGARLPTENFEMEITESVLMDNSIDSKNFLEMLIKQGMGISIDDFGTGYSSLSYITSFPITKIKIDISFVTKLPHDKNALAVVTAIIGLAKSLNLKVVAEGIETPEQLECLAKLGCTYGQGYLFSKPVPASDATQLLLSQGRSVG